MSAKKLFFRLQQLFYGYVTRYYNLWVGYVLFGHYRALNQPRLCITCRSLSSASEQLFVIFDRDVIKHAGHVEWQVTRRLLLTWYERDHYDCRER